MICGACGKRGMARQAKADEEEFARMQAEYEAEQAKKNKDSEV